MNLRRGLFRCWLVVSGVWLVAYVWYLWAHCWYLSDDTAMCWLGYSDWAKPISYFTLLDYVRLIAIALGVPIAALVLGAASWWAIIGFGHQNSN